MRAGGGGGGRKRERRVGFPSRWVGLRFGFGFAFGLGLRIEGGGFERCGRSGGGFRGG